MSDQKFLFLPAQPTPNGPLHLGHIAGPFLTMDIMHRFRKLLDDTSAMGVCIDRFDNYVTRAAGIERKTEPEVADFWSSQIVKDLETMNISVDFVFDPKEQHEVSEYEAESNKLFDDLFCTEAIVLVKEKFPYSVETGKFSAGHAISGNCPNCGSEVSSYFCETCASMLRPEEIDEPTFEKKNIEWKSVINYFVDPNKIDKDLLLQKLSKAGRSEMLMVPVCQQHFHMKPLVRLTTQADWGIEVVIEGERKGVLFNYHSSEFRLLGKRAMEDLAVSVNPFEIASDVNTVFGFGFDAIVNVTGELAIALLRKDYKPFDYLVPSFFLTIRGQKFSTSRKVAIFVEDVAGFENGIDTLRLYLASLELEKSEQDFDLDDLKTLNFKVRRFWSDVKRAIDDCSGETEIPREFETPTILRMESFLHPSRSNVSSAAELAISWIETSKPSSKTESRSWLYESAIVIGAFMPSCASFILELLSKGTAEVGQSDQNCIARASDPVLSYDFFETIEEIIADRVPN